MAVLYIIWYDAHFPDFFNFMVLFLVAVGVQAQKAPLGPLQHCSVWIQDMFVCWLKVLL